MFKATKSTINQTNGNTLNIEHEREQQKIEQTVH